MSTETIEAMALAIDKRMAELDLSPSDLVRDTGSDASLTFTNSGEGNFVVQSYSGSGSDLLVNEIGAYSGTIYVADSAFLAIKSEGNWTVTQKSS